MLGFCSLSTCASFAFFSKGNKCMGSCRDKLFRKVTSQEHRCIAKLSLSLSPSYGNQLNDVFFFSSQRLVKQCCDKL